MFQKAIDIIKILRDHKFKAYLVGGAVRDHLLKEPSNDYDIVTDAKPNEIIRIFSNRKIKTFGKSFKVVFIDDIEIATYRTDHYNGLSDKNCQIDYAKTIEEDLSRRDFTINAMAYNPLNGKLIDPFNGQKDLKDRKIIFVNNPEKRIYEDPNRILRACRFKTKIKGTFENKTKQKLIEYAHLVNEFIASERKRKEIIKAMSIENASLFFIALNKINALQYIFRSLDDCFAFDFETHGIYHFEGVGEHNMLTGDLISTKFPLLKLSGYLHDVGKPSACKYHHKNQRLMFRDHHLTGIDCLQNELIKLRFSSKEINYISSLIKYHMKTFHTSKSTRRILYKLSQDNISWKDLIKLKYADSNARLLPINYNLMLLNPKFQENLKNGNIKIQSKYNNEYFQINQYPKHILKDHLLRIRKVLKENKKKNISQNNLISGNQIMKWTNLQSGPIIGKIKKYLIDLILSDPQIKDNEKILKEKTIEYLNQIQKNKKGNK
jgi:tRNA nucleotidyltransferase (CCA-adding enzyme)